MNKFLYALRSIGITIVGVVIAVLVTSGLHQLFSLFLDPLPMEDLMAADWAGRSNIMETYMACQSLRHLQHAYRPLLWVCPRCILVRARHQGAFVENRKRDQAGYRCNCPTRTLDMGRCTKRSLRRACRRVLDHCRCNHYCCSDCACLRNCWRIA